jgi:hypothetical protein
MFHRACIVMNFVLIRMPCCSSTITRRIASDSAPFDKLAVWLWHIARIRNFFVTSKGYFGLGPCALMPGDKVVSFTGATKPMVVRSDGRFFKLLWPADVHRIMDGEAWPEERSFLDTFVMV